MTDHDFDYDYSPGPLPSSSPLPPPPPPQLSPVRRLAVQPPRLTVPQVSPSSSYAHGPLQTPASSTSLSLPFSPFVASSPATSSYAPSPLPSSSAPMAMRNAPSVPYNPQQWSRNGLVAGQQYAPHPLAQTATRPHDITGMEGILLFFAFVSSSPFIALCSSQVHDPTTIFHCFIHVLSRLLSAM